MVVDLPDGTRVSSTTEFRVVIREGGGLFYPGIHVNGFRLEHNFGFFTRANAVQFASGFYQEIVRGMFEYLEDNHFTVVEGNNETH